jgi:glycosyltransferase involved in cell wall biosynthesis
LGFPEGLARDVAAIDLPFHSKEGWARAARNLKRFVRGSPPLVDRFSRFDEAVRATIGGRGYELGVIEHFWCARYVGVLRERCTRVTADLHNIESVLLSRSARTHAWPIAAVLHRFAHACHKLEHRLLPLFDLLLVPSDADRVHTVQSAPLVNSVVYPNAIPLVPRPSLPKVDDIVFSGNLEYDPNVTAVQFFYERIWPVLRERWPRLTWRIVGRNQEKLARRLAGDDRIRFTGPVTDAIAELASARAAVVPVLAGSGTRMKIIEAWAAGIPVVSTRLGSEGLPALAGEHLLEADDPADFARAVSSLLEFPTLADKLADHGRALYEAELNWEAVWPRLAAAGI